MDPQELGLVKCAGCGSFVDPTICGCGDPKESHSPHGGHPFIPQGCACYRQKIIFDRGIQWKPGDTALAPGDPDPRPVTVLEILPNDWIKVEYPEGDTLKWKRWELKPKGETTS